VIHSERVRLLNDRHVRRGSYVLYWMQHAQRARCNHALVYAIREANRLRLPVLAVFGITQRFPEGNTRSYTFMLEGLRETQQTLKERGIQLVVRLQPPVEAAIALGQDAALVAVDRGYLRVERRWREQAAARLACPLVQVESDVVVPVETVSEKEQYGAYTIRPRIHTHLDSFLVPLEETGVQRHSLALEFDGVDLEDIGGLLNDLRINRGASAAGAFRGGASQAKALLEDFAANKLHSYAERRNEPSEDYLSHMSPYLHFGHISPLAIALRVRQAKGVSQANKDAYLEELIVRRELSMNFCTYNARYDSLACLPDWAGKTLGEHAADRRPHVYSLREFEQARTHDPYWNAAQREMVLTGKMHGYMRMYWGKKILEWSPSPEVAHRIALALNNRYEIDGRDPNGYTGVAWCFGKHDRAWPEREIYGKVRTMTATGLERKFDIQRYVRQVERLAEAHVA